MPFEHLCDHDSIRMGIVSLVRAAPACESHACRTSPLSRSTIAPIGPGSKTSALKLLTTRQFFSVLSGSYSKKSTVAHL